MSGLVTAAVAIPDALVVPLYVLPLTVKLIDFPLTGTPFAVSVALTSVGAPNCTVVLATEREVGSCDGVSAKFTVPDPPFVTVTVPDAD